MNTIRSHGMEPLDFELYRIAASAIDGGGVYIDAQKGTGGAFDAEFSV